MLPVITTQLADVAANAGNTLNYSQAVTVNPANGSLGSVLTPSGIPSTNQYATPGAISTTASTLSANLPFYALLAALAWFASRSF